MQEHLCSLLTLPVSNMPVGGRVLSIVRLYQWLIQRDLCITSLRDNYELFGAPIRAKRTAHASGQIVNCLRPLAEFLGFSEQARRWVKKFIQTTEKGLCKGLTAFQLIGHNLLPGLVTRQQLLSRYILYASFLQ